MKSCNDENVLKLLLKKPSFRLEISLVFGLFMNLVYIIGNLISAITNDSGWSFALGLYYLIIILMRIYILSSRERGNFGKWRVELYRVCERIGYSLVFLECAILGVMLYTVRRDEPPTYSRTALICFSVYTVYSLLSSLREMIRSHRRNEPLAFAARNLNLAAALTSVFNLQYATLVTLGAPVCVINRASVIGGVFVLLAISFFALWLITVSHRRIREAILLTKNSLSPYNDNSAR